jgi:predicted GIY-YIG superfamily endonuclease
MVDAIDRKKQLKRWLGQWKINLICNPNPEIKNLSNENFD